METGHYSIALRRWWWIVAVGAVVGMVLGWGASQLVKPTYTATSQVFVSLAQGNTAGELANGASYNQQQMASYAELATAPVVLDPVIESLKLPTTSLALAKAVSVTIPQATTILQIAVTDSSPAGSARIANAIAKEVGVAIIDVSPRTLSGETNLIIRTIGPATIPLSPSAPKTALNTLLGLVGGLLVGLAVVLLRARFDNRIRNRADLVQGTDTPVLASIVYGPTKRHPQARAMLDAPGSLAAESYRQLRADLQFVAVDQSHAVFVVTSALPREGKSTVVCNLALAIAEAGVPVLLVDSDLRRPAVADFFGLEGDAGLTTVLSGRATLTDVVQRWGDTTLDVLTSGAVPPNPSELLSSRAMVNLIESVGRGYDVVLIDSPPTLTIADAVIVARLSDGALIVVDAAQTRRPDVQSAIDSLRTSGVDVLGTMLNRARPDRTADAYYQKQEAPA